MDKLKITLCILLIAFCITHIAGYSFVKGCRHGYNWDGARCGKRINT
jgi:hypothetical protein